VVTGSDGKEKKRFDNGSLCGARETSALCSHGGIRQKGDPPGMQEGGGGLVLGEMGHRPLPRVKREVFGLKEKKKSSSPKKTV